MVALRVPGKRVGECFTHYPCSYGILMSLFAFSRSVTLVGEADRKILKAAIKHAAGEDQVRHRTVPPEAVAKWAKKLESLKHEIAGVMADEKEEKQVCISDAPLFALGLMNA